MALLAVFFLFILTTGGVLIFGVIFALKAKQVIPLDSALRMEKLLYQKKHERLMKCFYLLAIISVVLVKVIANENGGPWGPAWLMDTHLFIVRNILPVVVTLPLFFNGKKFKNAHPVFAYTLLAVLVPTLFTGLCLALLHPLIFG